MLAKGSAVLGFLSLSLALAIDKPRTFTDNTAIQSMLLFLQWRDEKQGEVRKNSV